MRGARKAKTARSRELRSNQTDAEKKLWWRLRNRQIAGCKFIRQEPIGRYICDFVCREQRLVVELDGGQHADSNSDKVRDAWLKAHNYRVMRFWNNDVLTNMEGVLQTIQDAVIGESPSPDLPSADRPLPASGER
jgi:very-short-patch-repair endonuclease